MARRSSMPWVGPIGRRQSPIPPVALRHRRQQCPPVDLWRVEERRPGLVAGWHVGRVHVGPGREAREAGHLRPPDRGRREPRGDEPRRRDLGLAWSPDGAHLAYIAAFDPDNPDEDDRPADAPPPVRVIPPDRLQAGQPRLPGRHAPPGLGGRCRQRRPPDGHHRRRRPHRSSWSPDGKTIAAKVANRNGMCSQLGLIDVATGAVTLVGPRDGAVAQWAFTPDGDRIIFAGDETQTWQSDFFVYDVAAGTSRRLTDDLQVLPDRRVPDDRRALAAGLAAGRPCAGPRRPCGRQRPLRLRSGHVRDGATSYLAGRAGRVERRSAGRYAVQGYTSLDALGEIVVTDLADAGPRR